MERGCSREMENSVHLGTLRVSPNDRWMLPTAKGSFSPRLNNVQNILHQRPEIDRLLTTLLKFYKRCVKGTMFLISKKNPHYTERFILNDSNKIEELPFIFSVYLVRSLILESALLMF